MRNTPCNRQATKEAKKLMEYLADISGKAILLGQHTQTRKPEELEYIEKVTGKLPALCGFELLAYSGNINWDTCDGDCLKELYENLGTIETALEWGRRGGIVTLTWHWYSPVGGRDKSFYAKNTDFDAKASLMEGTKEHQAMVRDLDLMAVHLKRFQQEKIPVLWRPFHEAEGTWFWWGAHGHDTARDLYRFMYHYYTEVHHIDNLLWVWNSPLKEEYPGDDMVDIISRDLYTAEQQYTSYAEGYKELVQITPSEYICALAEVGVQPDLAAVMEENIPWCWFMTWSKEFCLTEKYTDKAQLIANYNNPAAITLDKLPKSIW